MFQRTDTVVVTGGAGFIGSHLVDRLLTTTDARVVVLDNFRRGQLANLAEAGGSPRLEIVRGDIRDADLVTNTLRGATAVYHLAAQCRLMGAVEDLDESFTTNVVGTFNLLKAAAREAVPRVVFTSSCDVYGEPIELPVDEAHPLLAVNFYGSSKVTGEAYCRAFRRACGLNTIVLRLATVYGPRDFGRAIPCWLELAAAGEDLTVYGGKQTLDFIWVGQVVDALMRCCRLEGPTPPINIGSGTGTRIIDLARRIRLVTGGRSQVELIPARSSEAGHFVARVDRMRELLHVEPSADPLAHLEKLVPTAAAAAAPRGARARPAHAVA